MTGGNALSSGFPVIPAVMVIIVGLPNHICRALAASILAVPLALATGTASAGTHNWDGVAQCESSGNWHIDTGNGYYGGLQFTPSTWQVNGGSGTPSDASKGEQERVAENVLATQGPCAWPVCGHNL